MGEPWTNYLISLCLRFLFCKVGMIEMIPTSQALGKILQVSMHKVLSPGLVQIKCGDVGVGSYCHCIYLPCWHCPHSGQPLSWMFIWTSMTCPTSPGPPLYPILHTSCQREASQSPAAPLILQCGIHPGGLGSHSPLITCSKYISPTSSPSPPTPLYIQAELSTP